MGFKYFTHNWLIKGILDEEVHRMLRLYASGGLLDIGCGDRPYYSRAKRYADSYTGADYSGTPHLNDHIDIFCDAYHISMKDMSFDCVLCTEVLEHLEEPSTAIQEAYRLLKKGGYALYTVPFSWPIHEEPRDFYRYTKYGIKYLFEKNGFEIVEINALDGFAVKIIQSVVYVMQRLRKGGRINPLWWIVPVIGSIMQALALYANKHRRNEDNPNTDHYSIVVRKP
jgi:SAM-dependent methyltransferase